MYLPMAEAKAEVQLVGIDKLLEDPSNMSGRNPDFQIVLKGAGGILGDCGQRMYEKEKTEQSFRNRLIQTWDEGE